MSDVTATKMIIFSDLSLIFQTENYDTELNHLNDFVSRIFKDSVW